MEANLNLPEELIDQIVDRLIDRLDNKIRPPLMDVGQLASYLNVPIGWLYDRTRNKTTGLPFIKIGKYVRFNPEDVLEWLRKQD
jgi:excisionase family DNA binding protein